MNPMPDAAILAGGLGTRLHSKVPDLPKCMAPVAGRPFLDHLIDELRRQGIERFVLSLGYRHEVVLEHLDKFYGDLTYDYTIESTPLGTGGAALLSAEKISGSLFFLINGDTMFRADLRAMVEMHIALPVDITVALKPMHHFSRYGAVVLNRKGIVSAFEEKKHTEHGYINGGIYIISSEWFRRLGLPTACSFEKDVLETQVEAGRIAGFVSDAYFIDIGVPEDYDKANRDMSEI